MLPRVNTFNFPYLHLLGNYKWAEEFRLRFCKNINGLVAIGDAWSLGPNKAFISSYARKSLKNPRKIINYIGRGIEWKYVNSCGSEYSKFLCLDKPVFRYYSLFPRNFIEKVNTHMEMFGMPGFQMIGQLKDQVDDYDNFWKKTSDYYRSHLGPTHYPAFGVVKKEEHPQIMQELISNPNIKNYYVRPHILDLIHQL